MSKKFVTFGEIMLRLKSPAHERFFQSPLLEATFGGGEANVAVSLSLLGKDAKFVTALPNNDIGRAALRDVRKWGVDTSSIALATPNDFDFDAIMADAGWLHVTGITPAISKNAADSALAAMKSAKQAGATVSVDLNYRKKLWKWGKSAPEVMREMMHYTDVIVANEEDIQKCLGIEANVDVTSGELDVDVYKALTEEVKRQFPNLSVVAVTLRESRSADTNGWSAALNGKTGFYHSRQYEITDIIDRVGGGDSFSAGIIYALSEYGDDEEYAINFAVASSTLKHSIGGDFNLTTKSEVEALLKGDGSGRVQR